MKFPPVDEPTVIAINSLIAHCENLRRFCRTAIDVDPAQTLRPYLLQSQSAYERIAEDLRDGLFGTAGEATGGGLVSGLLHRLREKIGQRGGWRSDTELVDTLLDEQAAALDAFDGVIADISDERIRMILTAHRSILAGLKRQTEHVCSDM